MSANEIVKSAIKSVVCEGKEVFINAEVNTSLDDSWDVCIGIGIIHDGSLECLKHEPVGEVIERLEGLEVMKHLKLVDSDESSSSAFYKIAD